MADNALTLSFSDYRHQALTHAPSLTLSAHVLQRDSGPARDACRAVAPDSPVVIRVGALAGSCPISNSTRLPLGCTRVGDDERPDNYASLPFFLPSHHERTSGISIPQAGLGHVTVRAQIQAMTVASVRHSAAWPAGRVWPMRFSASSRIHVAYARTSAASPVATLPVAESEPLGKAREHRRPPGELRRDSRSAPC